MSNYSAVSLTCNKKPLHKTRLVDLPRVRLRYLKDAPAQPTYLQTETSLPSLDPHSQSDWHTLNSRLKARCRSRRKPALMQFSLAGSAQASGVQTPLRSNARGSPVYLKGVFRSVWNSVNCSRLHMSPTKFVLMNLSYPSN